MSKIRGEQVPAQKVQRESSVGCPIRRLIAEQGVAGARHGVKEPKEAMLDIQSPLRIYNADTSSPPDIDASEEVIPIEGEDSISPFNGKGTAHV